MNLKAISFLENEVPDEFFGLELRYSSSKDCSARMSGAGDDRWRGGGRGYDPNRQRYQGGSVRERSTGHGGQRNYGNNSGLGQHTGTGQEQGQEQHVPVRGFNAAEIKDSLKKAANAGGSAPVAYKPTGKDANNFRSSGPWGAKPNSMVGGKDFFLELRKQVTSLQQGGSAAGG